ncbi:hypothetical protein HORM4_1210002 [Vibrio harveyi]|nr:hypothetical protein HORM4_1210002 [Vibrio harveyi]
MFHKYLVIIMRYFIHSTDFVVNRINNNFKYVKLDQLLSFIFLIMLSKILIMVLTRLFRILLRSFFEQ